MDYTERTSLPVIPLPEQYSRGPGTFEITCETVIAADEANHLNALYLRDLLSPASGFPLPIGNVGHEDARTIRLAIGGEPARLEREGYSLEVSADRLTLSAPESAGVFCGIQTLRQLLPLEIEERAVNRTVRWQVPCVTIRDRPRFQWRGYMLDEARHFHGGETVLRALDLMALQKLNVFHWHLTDDQGWRIEIKGYPKLTEIGSVRKGTTTGFIGRHDGLPHSGFYTQDEVKEIVAYAAARNITIVPEIEMPGHCIAALAAYPELSCTGGPFEVLARFGPTWDVLCPGKESVFTFLENVLDEVIGIFPSPFIHIGGDEVLKRRWSKCPDCRRRMAQEGLEAVGELQGYFTNRVAAHLASRGRRLVGWNEILRDGLHETAVVQYWTRHRKEIVEAIRNGRDMINSSFMSLYLDHSYSLTPLSKAYDFEPVLPELEMSETDRVLGLEAPLWSEFVRNRARLDYQTYPRLTAFAETGWSPRQRKDYEDFTDRLSTFLQRLHALGVKHAPQEDWAPSRLKQLFGVFTIVRPQTRIADRRT
jgi:hexosaminidase